MYVDTSCNTIGRLELNTDNRQGTNIRRSVPLVRNACSAASHEIPQLHDR
jgi:hypothetical protein